MCGSIASRSKLRESKGFGQLISFFGTLTVGGAASMLEAHRLAPMQILLPFEQGALKSQICNVSNAHELFLCSPCLVNSDMVV